MNKIYKVIWNATLGTWVAVSEIAKGKTKNSVSIGQTVLVDNSYTAQLDKEFSYKKLLLAIFTVFTANFAHSGYEAGTASTSSNCTQTSTGSGGESIGAIAIGSDNSPALGIACASGINSVAIGKSSWATGLSALAIGPDTKARANYSIAMGNNAQALSQGSMAFGSGAYANSNSTADGTGAVAIGNDAVALGKNSFALGAASTVTDDNTVSFGYTKGDVAYFDGTPRTGTDVSNGYQNGKWINDRFMRLANVANGYKQENDAVNVSQIRPLAQALGTNVSATDGTVSAPNYTITKTDGTTYPAVQTVPDALKNLNDEVVKPLGFVGDSGTKATRKLGEDLNVKGGATGTLTNDNIGVVSNGSNQLDIKLAETVNLGTNGSVTTGNTKIDNSGLTITGGPSVTSTGINAGSKVITNVAAGSAATDAVNKGQLDSSLANANSNAAVVYTDAAGDKVTKAADGKWYAATNVNADGSLIGSPSEVAAANIITSVQNASGSTTTATKLGNVAAGSVTASSTDAINGSQLYQTFDMSVKYDKDATDPSKPNKDSLTFDSATAPAALTKNADGSFSAMGGGTSLNNVASAGDITNTANAYKAANAGDVNNAIVGVTNKGLSFGGDTGSDVQRKLGETLTVKGGVTDASKLSDNNIGVVTDTANGGLNVKLAKAITIDSVTAGNSKLDTTGLTVDNGTDKTVIGAGNVTVSKGSNSLALDASKGTLEGLSNKNLTATDFATAGRAATEEQLKLVNDAQTATNDFAVKYDKDATDPSKPNKDSLTFDSATAPAALTKNADGSFSAMGGGTSLNNVASAGDITNTANAYKAANAGDVNNAIVGVTNKGLSFGGDTGSDVQRKLGETLTVKGGVTDASKLSDNNIGVVTDTANGGLNVKLAKAITIDSVTAGNSKLDTTGLTVDNGTDKTVIGAGNVTVSKGSNSLALDASKGTLEGLSNKNLTATDFATAGRAATEEQLKLVNDAQTATNDFAVKYDKDATDPSKPNKDSLTFDSATAPAALTKNADGSFSAMGGGTSLNNVASAGDITNTANAYKAANAGDVNNAIVGVTNKGLSFGGDTGSDVQRKLGETLTVKGGVTDASKLSDNNIGVVTDTANGGLNVKLAKAITIDSVTAGNSKLDTTGLTVDNGTDKTVIGAGNVTVSKGSNSLALDASKGTLEGLSNKNLTATDFATAGRAATEEQLKLVNDAQTATNDFAVKYDKDATDPSKPNKDSLTFDSATAPAALTKNADGSFSAMGGGTSLNNVASAGDITNTANAYKAANAGDVNNAIVGVTNKGLSFGGDTGSDVQRKLGETLTVKGGVTDASKLSDNNIGVVTDTANGGLNVKLAKAITIDSVTAGNSKLDTTGLTVDNGTDKTVIGAGNVTVSKGSNSLALDASKGTLEGLSNKNLTATDFATAGRAATEEQLKLVNDAQTATNDFAVKYDKDATDPSKPNKDSLTFDSATAPAALTKNADGSFSAMGGGTSLNNVASAGDITNTANAYKAANAGDVNNAIVGVTNKGLSFGGDTGSDVQRKLGETLTVKGGVTDASKLSDNNIGVVTDTANGGLNVKLAKAITIDSVTAGNSKLDTTGLTVDNGTDKTVIGAGNVTVSKGSNSLALDASKGTLEGLSNKNLTATDFATAGRAATEEQLKLVNDAQTATNDFAVKYDKDATDPSKPNKDSLTFDSATAPAALTKNADGSFSAMGGGTSLNNVASAGDITNTANAYKAANAGDVNNAIVGVTNKGLSFGGDTGSDVQRKLGETLTVKGGVTDASKLSDNNIGVVTDTANGGLVVKLAKDISIDSVATDDGKGNSTVLNTAGTTVKNAAGQEATYGADKSVLKDGNNTTTMTAGNVSVSNGTNTLTLDAAKGTIDGLTNKTWDVNKVVSGQAATEDQLAIVDKTVKDNLTGVTVKDENGNNQTINISDVVVNKNLDNNNPDSQFITYNKAGQATTDRLTIAQTVQKMNTEGVKFFHTNAATSKGSLGTTNDSSAGGLNSTAVGVNAIVETNAVSALAVGHNTKAGGAQSIAIGNGAEALGTQSISIGTGNKVTGDHSGAIGDPTIVDGSNSYSVGNNNQVLTDDTFVLGNNVTQTVTGSVVLGTGSAATTGAGVAGYALSTATTADKTAISNTTSTTGAVAIGDAANGIYRQITGVAAGSQDSDAVNVAQLKAVGNQVTTTQTSLVNSLGGNAKVNADGSITGPTYNVAQGTQTNVGDALTALDQAIGNAATTSKTTVSNGENIVVSKTKNADGSDNYQVSTAKDLTVDSIKAGETVLNNAGIAIANNAVVLNNTGLVIAGGPSVTTQGINAGNKVITNVAAGQKDTDAVNKGQLDNAITNINNKVDQVNNNAVQYDKNADGTVNKDKVTLGGDKGTTLTNVADGKVTQGSKDAVNGGQLADIRDNLQGQITNNTNDINNIKNEINNGSLGIVKQSDPKGEITVGKETGGTTVNMAGKDGDRVVTGVKDGAINATSKDAINGSQLHAQKVETNQKVVEYLGGGAAIDNITGSFTQAPSYTVGDSKYNNVGGAIDALNKADQALGNKIDNVSNRLEQAFYSTNQRIDDVEKRANAGIAAAMSLENAPYIPGKYTYAAGAAYHGGESAIGVTLRKTADNGRWSLTGGIAAASEGDPSVRIGISGVID